MKPVKVLGNLLYFLPLLTQSVDAIVGGSDASANAAPFTAAVISSTVFGDSYICAGSLISSNTVLTTAGCADGSSASSLKVVKVIQHPNYNRNTRDSDFAILHLASSVADIEPVAISEQATITGAPVSLYGWGLTGKLSTENARVLQRLDSTFISADDCNPVWSDVNPVTGNMNCDAAPEKQQGSCDRDQGGPVISEAGELVGLIGYYNYCEQSSNGRPDVNNDPLSASDWITQNTI